MERPKNENGLVEITQNLAKEDLKLPRAEQRLDFVKNFVELNLGKVVTQFRYDDKPELATIIGHALVNDEPVILAKGEDRRAMYLAMTDIALPDSFAASNDTPTASFNLGLVVDSVSDESYVAFASTNIRQPQFSYRMGLNQEGGWLQPQIFVESCGLPIKDLEVTFEETIQANEGFAKAAMASPANRGLEALGAASPAKNSENSFGEAVFRIENANIAAQNGNREFPLTEFKLKDVKKTTNVCTSLDNVWGLYSSPLQAINTVEFEAPINLPAGKVSLLSQDGDLLTNRIPLTSKGKKVKLSLGKDQNISIEARANATRKNRFQKIATVTTKIFGSVSENNFGDEIIVTLGVGEEIIDVQVVLEEIGGEMIESPLSCSYNGRIISFGVPQTKPGEFRAIATWKQPARGIPHQYLL